MIESNFRNEMLLKEYEIIHRGIRGLDARLFQVKGWSIAIFAALSAFYIDDRDAGFLFISFSSSILFWLLEAKYKSFQTVLIDRSVELERSIKSGNSEFASPWISSTFRNRDKSLRSQIRRVLLTAKKVNVAFLYFSQIFVTGLMPFGALAIG